MINVGVIGVGSEWNQYGTALQALHHPVGVCAVYDSVHARAEQAAETLTAVPAKGIGELVERRDICAVLLLQPGWAGTASLNMLSRCGKPVFIRPWMPAPAEFFEKIHARTSQAGLMLMPTMWRRYMPATMRLQELLATQLGQPLRLEVRLDLSADSHPAEKLVGWLDFARNLFRTYPKQSRLESDGDHSLLMTIPYPTGKAGEKPREAVFHLSSEELTTDDLRSLLQSVVSGKSVTGRQPRETAHDANTGIPIAQIHCLCESGSATLLSRTSLTWQKDAPSRETDHPHREELRFERNETLVMLDLFCRRLVGGLIPVADFSDISRALRLIESVL